MLPLNLIISLSFIKGLLEFMLDDELLFRLFDELLMMISFPKFLSSYRYVSLPFPPIKVSSPTPPIKVSSPSSP